MNKKLSCFTIILTLIFLTFHLPIRSQDIYYDGKFFLRLYDREGKKFEKGHLRLASDTLLVLYRRGEQISVPLSEIGFIRTKRSMGHNILVGTSLVTTFMIIGFVSTAPGGGFIGWDAGTGVLFGIVAGIFYGPPISALSLIFKKVSMYIINGDIEQWEKFKADLRTNKKLLKN